MARSSQDHAAINRMLGTHGLPQLESGPGLMQALGFLVQDHEHLRSLLIRCEPENRSGMYDSLTPYLRFKARPLDTYIAESARMAEAKQLPVMGPDGTLTWPKPAPSVEEIAAAQQSTKELFAAQDSVDVAFAKVHLMLTCSKCTKQDTFSGRTKADAVFHARQEGWVYYEHEGVAREICPDCPAIRKTVQKVS